MPRGIPSVQPHPVDPVVAAAVVVVAEHLTADRLPPHRLGIERVVVLQNFQWRLCPRRTMHQSLQHQLQHQIQIQIQLQMHQHPLHLLDSAVVGLPLHSHSHSWVVVLGPVQVHLERHPVVAVAASFHRAQLHPAHISSEDTPPADTSWESVQLPQADMAYSYTEVAS